LANSASGVVVSSDDGRDDIAAGMLSRMTELYGRLRASVPLDRTIYGESGGLGVPSGLIGGINAALAEELLVCIG
jgi:hypothetical protein